MTLHEAIEKLLRQFGRPMTTTEIANELNKNQWYQKKDGSNIQAFQIHGRTRNYANLFNRDGSTVSLLSQPNVKIKSSTIRQKVDKQKPKLEAISKDRVLLEKVLMNEKNFKRAGFIDNIVPNNSGLYCIRIDDSSKLPKEFSNQLKYRNHNIIYIGVASQSLQKRFLNQELRARGHGTFFRSLGAVLGYRPMKGSLRTKSNKRNYKFSIADEQKIISWINRYLLVNWVEFNGNFEDFETEIIKKYLPLLNIAKNPAALPILTDLRFECVRIAND